MTFALSWYSIVSAIAVLPALVVARIVWARRAVPGGRFLAWLMLAFVVWSIGAALESAVQELAVGVTFAKLYYVGALGGPLAFLLFTLEYVRSKRWLTHRHVAMLAFIPALSWILALTNEWHYLVWTDYARSPQFANLWVYGHGPWFWIGVVGYSYLMMAVATVLLIRTAIRPAPQRSRAQAFTLIIAGIIPWVGNILYSLKLGLVDGIETTQLLFLVSGILIYWTLFRFRLLDVIPIALRTVVESMSDAIVVLDAQDRVIDLNRAAAPLLGINAADVIGCPVKDVFSHWPAAQSTLATVNKSNSEISVSRPDTGGEYSISSSPIRDARKPDAVIGRLIVLRNQTKRIQADKAMQRAALLEGRALMAREFNDKLEHVLNSLAADARSITDQIEHGNYIAAMGQLGLLRLAAHNASIDVYEHIVLTKTDPIDANGFVEVTLSYFSHFETITGIKIQLSLPAQNIDSILPEYGREHLLCIVQEAMDNVYKHAHADKVQVTFATFADSLQVIISDDGAGFDAPSVGNGSGGLRKMHDRAVRLGAELEIRSEQGRGTQVVLQMKRAKPDVVKTHLTKVTVLIADNSALVAEGLKSVLAARGLVVLGITGDGDEAISLAAKLQPAMVLLDVHMPVRPGALPVRRIKEAAPGTQVVLMSSSADSDELTRSMGAGANGFLIKTQPVAELLESLVAIRLGTAVFAPGQADHLVQRPVEPEKQYRVAHVYLLNKGLSPLQVDILNRVSKGQVYKSVAVELDTTEAAIKYHVERIESLLNVTNRSELIAYAVSMGLIHVISPLISE